MANDYALEELGPRAFEQLAVALAAATIGTGIEAFGSGKDGGREATYTGRIPWSSGDGGQVWDGYTVLQAKQKEHPSADPARDLNWLKVQIRDELAEWMRPDSKRGRFPNYLIFVTNVRLTSQAGSGGIDQINKYVADRFKENYGSDEHPDTLAARGLREVKVWHRDYLNARLTQHADIRAAFPALLTVGDLLTRLQALPGFVEPEQFAPVLIDHAQTMLRAEQWVRFEDAGDSSSNKRPVDRVIVNLPARVETDRVFVLHNVIERADAVLRRSQWRDAWPRHLVITGQPGNGKSTITRYLTQVYRSQFASHEADQQSVIDLINNTARSLNRLRLASPKSPRWPLRVELAEMAADMGPEGGRNIRRWLCDLITENAGIQVQPVTFERWLKAWPCVLFFDGLDEVTAVSLRQRVIEEITGLVELADAIDADLFIVITTRPTGYNERVLPDHFDQIDLDYLDTAEATAYGHHITHERFHDDPSFAEHVLTRFKAAAVDPSAQRLLKTPLQVLILTITLASSGTLPANRYLLFWSYYETILKREGAKPTTHRQFFADYQTDITDLHQRVGLLLQIQSDVTGEARARLPRAQLWALARQRMMEVGHEEREAQELADRILDVATQRLVLLVADEEETVSFDVRSLQELMAARALVDGDDATISRNLTVAACNPNWRNTWLFAAGRLFTDSDHRRNLVVSIVERCDTDVPWPGWLYPAAPELAAHLLDDGLAVSRPNAQRRLIDVALRCLKGPMPDESKAVAVGLSAATAANVKHRALIRNELARALAGEPVQRAVAGALIWQGDFGSRIPGRYTDEELRRPVDLWQHKGHPLAETVTVGALLRSAVQEWLHGDALPEAGLLAEALPEWDKLTLIRTDLGDLWPTTVPYLFNAPKTYEVLVDAEASQLLEICLGTLQPSDWAAGSMLARAVWNVISRTAVSQRLGWPDPAEGGRDGQWYMSFPWGNATVPATS